MKLEDRMSDYFRTVGDGMGPPLSDVDTIMDEASRRDSRRRLGLIAGGLGGLAMLAVVAVVGSGLVTRSIEPSAPIDRRLVVSPYVALSDVRTGQAEAGLMVYTSPRPSYQRLVTLEDYSDGVWKTSVDLVSVDGVLPRSDELGDDVKRVDIRQEITIGPMDRIWLPVPGEPVRVDSLDEIAVWNGVIGSLAVGNARATGNGLMYEVVSSWPIVDADELRTVADSDPPVVIERYTQVPDRQPGSLDLDAIALTVTDGLTNRFDRALALQDFLRTFEVDPAPTTVRVLSPDPVEHVVLNGGGRPEDIAGTFVILARHAGLPARLAVGFTWGDEIDVGPDVTTYEIDGRHAHAWPEVYFDGIGWIPFEPVQGYGNPVAERYTGIPAAQVD